MLYHDESTVHLSGSTHAIWCKRGKKKIIFLSGNKSRLILSGVVNAFTGEILLNTTTKMTSEDFINFLILTLAHYPDKKIIMIADNASWHKSKLVKEFLENQKRLKIEFLPPYSPELNPIEKYWNWLKHSITKNKYYKKISDLAFEIGRFGILSNENKDKVKSRIGL